MKKVLFLLLFSCSIYAQSDCQGSQLPTTTTLEITIIDNQDNNPNDGYAMFTYEHIFEPVSQLNPNINFEIAVSSVGWFEPLTPLPAPIVGGSEQYFYKVTNTETGCESISNVHIIVQSSVAELNENIFSNLTYYPNPVKDKLNIESNYEIDTISVHNSLGQKVSSTLDFSTLSTGVYFVNLFSAGASKTIKVVKE